MALADQASLSPDTANTRPPPDDLVLWQEAMAQLRHLSEDVNRNVRLFLPLNLALLLAMVLLAAWAPSPRAALMLALLAILGIPLNLAARYLLKRHRVYYLQILAKKSLLDDRLGLYQKRFAGTSFDMVLPWRLPPEVAQQIKADPEAWIHKSIRGPNTMARVFFLVYEICLVLSALFFVVSVWLFSALLSR
jgi:hypothetical protein